MVGEGVDAFNRLRLVEFGHERRKALWLSDGYEGRVRGCENIHLPAFGSDELGHSDLSELLSTCFFDSISRRLSTVSFMSLSLFVCFESIRFSEVSIDSKSVVFIFAFVTFLYKSSGSGR